MKDEVTLNKKEQQRLMALNRVRSGELGGKQAATLLGVSLRHVRRLLAAYRIKGAAALAHGNRGRRPDNKLDGVINSRVRALAETTYTGFNNQHFTELLAERENIVLSRSSVRRILLEAGIKSPRKRRPPKHRSRRERYPQEGMLLQTDGSDHAWLEERGPRLTLIGAIDDATGKVAHCLFREHEDAHGYFLLFREIVVRHGIPAAIYHDRHSIFEHGKNVKETIEEQLEGKRNQTQFGRLLTELGITSIPSYSPQARGRIERLWSTFQDRLRGELRLAGATTIDEANAVLREFVPRYNRKFAVPAVQDGSAYRIMDSTINTDELFCFKYVRTVGTDNVVQFDKHRIQLLPTGDRMSYARVRVEVHERLDGSVAVYHQGRCLTTRPAPPEATVLRARNMPRVSASKPAVASGSTRMMPYKPAPDHPWRGSLKPYGDKG